MKGKVSTSVYNINFDLSLCFYKSNVFFVIDSRIICS